jgi:hypothetical protein
MMKNLRYNWNMPNDDRVSFAMEGNKQDKKASIELWKARKWIRAKKKWPPKGSPLWVQMEDSIKERLLLRDWWFKKNKSCRNKKRWKVWTKTIDHL